MRRILNSVIVATAAIGIAGGMVRAQGTVCDSPCKFILLPIYPRAESPPVPNSNPLSELQQKMRLENRNAVPEPFQLLRVPTPLPGTPTPLYPDSLKKAGIEGRVLAKFDVDTLGVVDVNTIEIVQATDQLFAVAVLDVLPRIEFSPPLINGIKVRRTIYHLFEFNIKR